MAESRSDGTVSNSGRNVGLDLLRLAAILLVIGRHFEEVPSDLPGPLHSFFTAWRRGGWIGVDLFFVLSGFLVAGLLFAEYRKRGAVSISRFYVRRGWKIYPPFFILIAFTAVRWAAQHKAQFGSRLLVEYLFLQSYFPAMWNHTWSLAVEEHFYLALPVLVTLLIWLRRGADDPFRVVPAIGAWVAVAVLSLRIWNASSGRPFAYLTHAFPTHLRIDSLFFGVVIAYVYHFRSDWFRATFHPHRFGLIAAGLLGLAPAFVLTLEKSPFIWTFGFTLMYLGSGAILVGVLLSDIPRTRAVAALAGVGAYSYSIYLWHMAVMTSFVPRIAKALRLDLGYVTYSMIGLVASLALGVVLSRLIEIPTLRLRDRLFPSRVESSVVQIPGPVAT